MEILVKETLLTLLGLTGSVMKKVTFPWQDKPLLKFLRSLLTTCLEKISNQTVRKSLLKLLNKILFPKKSSNLKI